MQKRNGDYSCIELKYVDRLSSMTDIPRFCMQELLLIDPELMFESLMKRY